jgi:peptidyl-prolyl cis-trans isomerase C
MNSRKEEIEVSKEDIRDTMDKLATTIPPEQKIETFLKLNNISQEDVIFAIKVNKFSNMTIGEKVKPTQKEISKFYNENREKLFMEPESVHVRHILVALGKNDSDKVKAQKKEKIENLRKQLLDGGNFAELASKNSDCPSKEVGGDLSFIQRGQMAKPFDEAAFSQEKNAIGPVIKTEFGYHIIQVLEHKQAKKVSLENAKNKISAYLERQKKSKAFNDMLNKLQEKAKIIIY